MGCRHLAWITCVVLGVMLAGVAMAAPRAAPQAAETEPLGLRMAWQLTQQNFPGYQAAVSGREAGQANRALGRAGYLPHLSAQFSRIKNHGEKTEPGLRGEVTTDLDYTSRENGVTVSQTLFDWSEVNAWRQGNAKADRSTAVFHNKVRAIAMDMVKRYLQLLLTQQNVDLAEQNLSADKRHIDIARSLYQDGAGTITDVQEAKAQRARSFAELQKARSSLAVARRKLQAMTGRPAPEVYALAPGFAPQPLQPESLTAWIARAQDNNADVHVAQGGLRVAAREVDKSVGDLLPTLSLSASYSRDHSNSLSLVGVDSKMTAVGATLQVPIFAGGEHWARKNQSQYKYQQTRQQLAATQEQVAVEVARQYWGVVSGAEHIRALHQAAQTTAQTLAAVRRSYQAGTRSISDILEAQRQLHQVRQELAQARLNYVQARIKLAIVASDMDAGAILARASRWFGAAVVAGQ